MRGQARSARGAGDHAADERAFGPRCQVAHIAVAVAGHGAVIGDQFRRGLGLQMLEPAGDFPALAGVDQAGPQAFGEGDFAGEQRLQFAGRQFGGDRKVGVAAAAARTDHDLAGELLEALHQGVADNRQARDHAQAVAIKRRIGGEDVHVQPQFAQACVAREGGPQRRQPRALRLNLGHPIGLIIEHQRD